MPNHSVSLTLLPDNAQRLANLCGRLNEHIQQIEADMALKIRQRGNVFLLTGDENAVANGKELLEMLYQSTANAETLNPNQVHLAVQEFSDISASGSETDQAIDAASLIKTPKGSIKPRSNHQREYVRAIWRNDINFGIGPAGTGKTYLAVACAVEALSKEKINRRNCFNRRWKST